MLAEKLPVRLKNNAFIFFYSKTVKRLRKKNKWVVVERWINHFLCAGC
jgi:hypothetical protein